MTNRIIISVLSLFFLSQSAIASDLFYKDTIGRWLVAGSIKTGCTAMYTTEDENEKETDTIAFRQPLDEAMHLNIDLKIFGWPTEQVESGTITSILTHDDKTGRFVSTNTYNVRNGWVSIGNLDAQEVLNAIKEYDYLDLAVAPQVIVTLRLNDFPKVLNMLDTCFLKASENSTNK